MIELNLDKAVLLTTIWEGFAFIFDLFLEITATLLYIVQYVRWLNLSRWTNQI